LSKKETYGETCIKVDVGLGGGASHHLRGRFVPDGQGRKIQEKCMGYNTVARTLRVSPQKLNLVAALIRGKKVDRALAELEFSRKRIAGTVKKTLESAIANAENNHDLDVDALVVAEAYVGKSITMKRFHARGRGRASRIEKPFSHLTIVVREVEEKGEAA
jgi:large subunit ribosomal protein L22